MFSLKCVFTLYYSTILIMSPTELKMQPTIHLEGKSSFRVYLQLYVLNVLWVAFSIPSSSLSLVNHLILIHIDNDNLDAVLPFHQNFAIAFTVFTTSTYFL
jgi:hypothetical protein